MWLRLQKVWRVSSVVWWCALLTAVLCRATTCRVIQSVTVATPVTTVMALSAKQDKINLDCWSAMDKIADCATRMLRGTKSTPGFCSQNIEVSSQLAGQTDGWTVY